MCEVTLLRSSVNLSRDDFGCVSAMTLGRRNASSGALLTEASRLASIGIP